MSRKILPILSTVLLFYSNSFSQDDIRTVPYQEDIRVNPLNGKPLFFHHRYIAENLERLTLISANVDISFVTRHLISKPRVEQEELSLVFRDEKTVQTSDNFYTVYSLELKLLPTLEVQDSAQVYDFYSLTSRKEIFVNDKRTFFLVIHDGGIGNTKSESVGLRKPVDGFVDRASLLKDGRWLSIEFTGVSGSEAFVKTQKLYLETVNAVTGKY